MMPAALIVMGMLLLTGMLFAGLSMLRDGYRQERLAARIQMIHGRPHQAAVEREAFQVVAMRALASLGQVILRTGLVSSKTLNDLRRTLEASGMRSSQGVTIFIACKLLLVALLPLLAWAVEGQLPLPPLLLRVLPLGAGVLGLTLPDWLVGKQRARYLQRLEQGLPDALDMMVICTQAGLALGPSIIRVGAELQNAYPEIAAEFELTANELQMNSDPRFALNNLGTRSGLEGFKRLSGTLLQTIQYGTPVSDALRVLSAEMRQEALIAFEGRAARLPVMLTMPMIVFILPCIFLIVGGPAMMQIMKAFRH
jgi:tight adherence protein C